MREYMVVSDSTADLPVDIVRELQVPIIPFSYSIDETVYEYYLDERDGDISDFYEKLRKGAMPVTSQVNPVRYQEIFTKYVEEGQDILYVWIVSVVEDWRRYGDGEISGCTYRMCGFTLGCSW